MSEWDYTNKRVLFWMDLNGDFKWVCSTTTSQNIYGRAPTIILLTMRPSRLFVKIRCHAVLCTRKRSAVRKKLQQRLARPISCLLHASMIIEHSRSTSTFRIWDGGSLREPCAQYLHRRHRDEKKETRERERGARPWMEKACEESPG
ncbi:core histone macro-H2A.1 [Trichonephila clavipes]|nr:core histone macro-H2A.1 [Trichonephila clavipes]